VACFSVRLNWVLPERGPGLSGPAAAAGAASKGAATAAAAVTVGFYIVIDPLTDGLYRTRLYAGAGHAIAPGSERHSPHGTNCALLG
jgi:hypothetical protein